MANWKVKIVGKNIRKTSVESLANKMKEQFGEGASISVSDDTPPESRADRFSEAQVLIVDAKSEMENLRDELQEWYDNLPESFQSGDKGDSLNEAISNLEEAISSLEQAEGVDVEFPGMY